MSDTGFIYARNLEELYRVSALIPRDGVQCVKCDSNTELSCPNNCAENEVCVYKAPSDCSQCATSSCILAPGMPEKKGGNGPNIGGIVGGVIGGIVAITVLTYLIWRYCIKPKRSEMSPSIYEPDPEGAQGSEKDTASRRTRPPSTHTVHSIASTVLTRASNIIQIAYIPGVTNRATPTSPAVLVPPVPPIPMHHAAGNRGSGYEEQHFFVPGDLRDSTYSGLSGYSDRTSYARTSYAPRSSIASTIYGKQAQVLAPAQTGMRAKPTVVSVKSVGNSSTDNSSTPPLPSINFEKYTTRPKSGASAFSVGSTFLNSANTATQARAQVVKVGTGLKKIEISSVKSETSSSAPSLAAVSPAPSMKNTARDSNAITIIEDSPSLDQGPFSDPPERSSPQKSINAPSLGAVVEEDGADDRGMIRVAPPPREKSPFGDQHATKEQS